MGLKICTRDQWLEVAALARAQSAEWVAVWTALTAKHAECPPLPILLPDGLSAPTTDLISSVLSEEPAPAAGATPDDAMAG